MRFVKRSWGFYITLLDRERFKVKLLRFKKGGELSKQFHNERNELWCFLSGYDEGTWKIYEARKLHTYAAKEKTWILEIQFGTRCAEDDIVRLQ